MSNHENLKAKIRAYLATGKSVNDLKKKDKLYQEINGAIILKEDNTKMTMKEKFEFLGYPRQQKRTANIEESIRSKIAEYKAIGRAIEDLQPTDSLYKYIKNSHFKGEKDRPMTIKEVLAFFGETREGKRDKDLKTLLIESIDDYIAKGGNLHIKREDLPFFSRLNHYSARLKKSPEEAMHELGYRQYSDIYHRLRGLELLPLYRDENGFVDSYRQDEPFRNYIGGISKFLEIPIALVVMLVGDENLKEAHMQTEYLDYISKELDEYIKQNGSLDRISVNNQKLYDQLRKVRKEMFADMEKSIPTENVLHYLGVGDVYNNFNKKGISLPDLNYLLDNLVDIAKNKDWVISRDDISVYDYRPLLAHSARMGIPLEELLKTKGIKYVGGKNASRFSRTVTSVYPLLDEMRKRRDELVALSGISIENGNCKEEVFEKKIEASVQAYKEYSKKLDSNFNDDFDYTKKRKQIKNLIKN